MKNEIDIDFYLLALHILCEKSLLLIKACKLWNLKFKKIKIESKYYFSFPWIKNWYLYSTGYHRFYCKCFYTENNQKVNFNVNRFLSFFRFYKMIKNQYWDIWNILFFYWLMLLKASIFSVNYTKIDQNNIL